MTNLAIVLLILLQQVNAQLGQVNEILQFFGWWYDHFSTQILCKVNKYIVNNNYYYNYSLQADFVDVVAVISLAIHRKKIPF